LIPKKNTDGGRRPDLGFPNHDTEIMQGKPRGASKIHEDIAPRSNIAGTL
jgi:hypothetical protein